MANQTLASTSTAATPNSHYHYEAFINHRGPEVKKIFASHLYRLLLKCGVRAFLDQQELQEGENFKSQIEGAIATASVHIAIFSPRYAESEWCLNELLRMLESGAPIIPVFYHVKPTELRWTRGEEGCYARVQRFFPKCNTGKDRVYAKSLCNLARKRTYDSQTHRMKPRYESSTIENWREALSRVAEISGLELEAFNWDEGELAEKVVERVVKMIRKTPFPVATYSTGLDVMVEEIDRTVLQQRRTRGEPKVLGIVGPGGIGKTTLAKEFFNRKRSDYDQSSFLFDVRAASLIDLQNKLVKDFIPFDPKIDNVADGMGKLSRYLYNRQALVVLDDVDNVEQLNALFSPVKAVLRFDSLILLTSRHKDILSGVKESSIYNMRGLNAEQSQQLFCWHAFHQPRPVVGFEEIVEAFLHECIGLPLSLKVLGTLLYEKNDLKYWKDQLCKLSKVLPTDILSSLKISYDSLDHQDKQIFLDIACFFLGKDRDTAIRIWEGSGWQGSLGLVNLENRCLIEVDNKNRLRMHHHLRDLGRYLADKEPPGCPRRLWLPTGNLSHNVFLQSYVRGVSIFEQISRQSVGFSNCSVDMSGLQLLSAEGDCLGSMSNMLKQSDITWLRWDRCPYPSLPPWIPLRNLRVLEVAGGQLETLWQSANEAPLELRELNIGSLLRFPRSIEQLRHLEKIEMEDTIQSLPEEFFRLPALKHLRVSTGMERLPDSLGNLTNLQHIDLSDSRALQTLPPSIGNLTNLRLLKLDRCFSLKCLPHSFGNLGRLKHLCLAGCSKLTLSSDTLGNINDLKILDLSLCYKMEVLPPQVTHQRFLEEINLSMTMLKELPSDIGNLINLEVLKLDCSPFLETLPPSLGSLTRLKELSIIFCPSLKCLPESVEGLKQLTKLVIDYTSIEHLPVGVMGLNNLEILNVKHCPLQEVPFSIVGNVDGTKEALALSREYRLLFSYIDKGMRRLKHLDLQGTSIKEVYFPRGVFPNLHHLNISFCLELVEVGSLPTSLISLNLKGCTALKKITGLCGLVELRRLDIQRCDQVEELPGLETLISLEELRASGCCRLKSIPGLAEYTNLRIPSSDAPECDMIENNLFQDLRLNK